MAKRKVIKVEKKPTGRYVWEDYRNPPKRLVLGYRTVKTKGGHVVRVAILRKKGPRGGRTVATSVGHPITERSSSNPRVNAMLRRLRRQKQRR